MNLGLLLVPALSGYVLLSCTYVSRYWFARQSGYSLFFAAAVAGVVLLGVARWIVVLLHLCIPSEIYAYLRWHWHSYAPFDYSGTVMVSTFLAITLPLLVNRIAPKHKSATRIARYSGDLIECLIQDVIESGGKQLVEVSTKSSKCYIGFAQESGVAAGTESDIAISPIVSGYRHSETRDLILTTNYAPFLLDSKLDIEHFRVVIPLAEVASARRIDPELHYRINAGQQGRSSTESAA